MTIYHLFYFLLKYYSINVHKTPISILFVDIFIWRVYEMHAIIYSSIVEIYRNNEVYKIYFSEFL